MKKTLLNVIVVGTFMLGFLMSPFPVDAAVTDLPAPDEGLMKVFLQKTTYTRMIFTGSNQSWDCSYTVMDTLQPIDEVECTVAINVSLIPKFTWEKYVLKKFSYLVHTSNGCIIGDMGITTGSHILVKTYAPIPNPSETVYIRMTSWFDVEVLPLTNNIPSYVISPRQAFQKALEVFYRSFGQYPTEAYTFNIEYRDNQYWLVTFDDHDGVGGLGYVTVNVFTGETGDYKEDE